MARNDATSKRHWVLDLNNTLAAGNRTITIKAYASNGTTATKTWNVTVSPITMPNVTALSVTPTTGSTTDIYTFTVTTNIAANKVILVLNGRTDQYTMTATNTAKTTWTKSFNGTLGDGARTASATAYDSNNRTGSGKTVSFTVNKPPITVDMANSATKDYVNKTINSLVFGPSEYRAKINDTLDKKKSVVMFFEGAGANLSNAEFKYGALCVVIKKINGTITKTFEYNYATTIPTYLEKTRNCSNGGCSDVPTVKDGIHNIITTNHDGYSSVKVKDAKVIRWEESTKTGYEDTSTGINIHKSGYSVGCFMIGSSYNDTKYFTFINAIESAGDKNDRGIVYVDRSQATSYLLKRYSTISSMVRSIQGK